jgi:hypothetical protein
MEWALLERPPVVSQHVVDPKCSLAHSQELSTCPCPEPDPHHPILSLHCLGLPSGLLPSGFPTYNQYAFLLSPINATFPAQLILNMIILIIQGEKCKSQSS